MLAAGSLKALKLMEENVEMFDDIHEKCILMQVERFFILISWLMFQKKLYML